MSEWSYVAVSYGLTWATLAAYGAWAWNRAARAARALAEAERPGGRP